MRFGGVPDYSLTNLKYLEGKTKNHAAGSLELIVENLVKTWEMERSHKTDPNQHRSVDPEKFHVGAKGWKKYNNQEANAIGNYNVLLAGCPAQLYDSEKISWEQSTMPSPPSLGNCWKSSLGLQKLPLAGAIGESSLVVMKGIRAKASWWRCLDLVWPQWMIS